MGWVYSGARPESKRSYTEKTRITTLYTTLYIILEDTKLTLIPSPQKSIIGISTSAGYRQLPRYTADGILGGIVLILTHVHASCVYCGYQWAIGCLIRAASIQTHTHRTPENFRFRGSLCGDTNCETCTACGVCQSVSTQGALRVTRVWNVLDTNWWSEGGLKESVAYMIASGHELTGLNARMHELVWRKCALRVVIHADTNGTALRHTWLPQSVWKCALRVRKCNRLLDSCEWVCLQVVIRQPHLLEG